MDPEHRLLALGLTLPVAKKPAGNYVSAVRSGNLLFISGRAATSVDGSMVRGKFGQELDAAEGYVLARIACLDLMSVIKSEAGSLDAVSQIVELQGALNTTASFEDHAAVLDGASDLLVAVFGEAGKHARAVAGVESLRNGVPLTLKAIVELKSVSAE